MIFKGQGRQGTFWRVMVRFGQVWQGAAGKAWSSKAGFGLAR